MKLNRANIPIQELNCHKCAVELANRLSQIKKIDYLEVNFKTSVVSFNFERANEIADVENMLADLGFNPLGEKIKQKKRNDFLCKAASEKLCINI